MDGPLSELKVTPSFCSAFKIPDDVTASTKYIKPPLRLFGKLMLENKGKI